MGSVDVIRFKINGKDYEVSGEGVNDRLVHFLQSNGSSGTHITCYEGGCGACTVVASVPVPGTSNERRSFSLNSCLASLYGCDGWEITTIEGLGNRFDGYHLLQERLADYNGSQCGFCSPGMVMNMYGLTKSQGTWTDKDVEKHMDGNLCRCTGYRPILDAFKSVTLQDIEDAVKTLHSCPKGRKCCKEGSMGVQPPRLVKKEIVVDGVTWHQPTSIKEMNSIIAGFTKGTKYKLVCGNTGSALYSDGACTAVINTRMIPELYVKIITTDSAVFGANLSVTELISEFEALAKTPNFFYLTEIVEHWKNIANASVRNLGSVGGNLVLRAKHHEFPSDIFITLLAAAATVNISSDAGSTIASYYLETMLAMNFIESRSVLLQIRLLPLPVGSVYRSFKLRKPETFFKRNLDLLKRKLLLNEVMPRNANSRAYVAAAFCLQLDNSNGRSRVIGKPVLSFTGISSSFVRATSTEAYITGKNLEDLEVLQGAVASLAVEVIPTDLPQDPSSQYRISVVQNLFYKFILGLVSEVVSPDYLSGSTILTRPLSSGIQTFQMNKDTWPLGKPVTKLEAKIQCSGEAEFVKTMKPVNGEVVGLFLQSTRANAAIKSIDASHALNKPGVVGFVSAKDIPGINNIIVFSDPNYKEQLFPSERVSYYGQPIGLIVATSRAAAYVGLYAVQVQYEDEKAPILSIQDALEKGSTDTLPDKAYKVGDVEAAFSDPDNTIVEGSMSHDGQCHFHMETQNCLAVPIEDGLDIYSSSQWLTETQASIAQVLGIPDNSINVTTRRVGGGFGAKIDRCNIVATAASLAAYTFRRPVKIDMDFRANMTAIGWREPYLCKYKVAVSSKGLLKAVQAILTCDSGYVAVDASVYYATTVMHSCYECPNWDVEPQVVITNTASNTWCRAPACVEAITFMENIMDHVAAVIGEDPLEFRRKNMTTERQAKRVGMVIPKLQQSTIAIGLSLTHTTQPQEVVIENNLINTMIDKLIEDSDYNERKAKVAIFNQTNRWRKRGIAIMPMLFPYICPEVYGFGIIMSIYAHDGTVAIAHGGIEIGQGINTKVAQVAAYILGCDYEKVIIKPTNTLSGANSNVTGGCNGSDINMFCVKQAALKLRARLDAIIKPSWEEKIAEAYNQGVDLTERYWNGKSEVKSYSVFGVACTEVELDILTGQFMVTRTDILEDAGRSPSPLIDIGQVEGAFIMGQGLFTSEKPIYDPKTGRRVSDTTWLYKPPTALDIPIDFRITLLDNAPNELGVLSSKVTGEPPLCLAFSIVMSLRQAITSARAQTGNFQWFTMNAPLTIDNIHQLCLTDQSMLTFGP